YAGENPDPLDGLRRGRAKGDLKFELRGKRLRGAWVLIRTQGRGERQPQWLLIKQRDDEAIEGTDVTEEFTTSVGTGRTMDEIATGAPRMRARAAGRK